MIKTLWLKRQTEGARLFYAQRPGADVAGSLRQVWIPKSVTSSFRKIEEPRKPVTSGVWLGPPVFAQCEVEIEEWWWEKNKEHFESGSEAGGAGKQQSLI